MHSTASDGTDTPEELISKCADLALLLCSVTDHDNTDAQMPAITEAARLGQPYITGVELSVQYSGELHILGYGVDIAGEAFRNRMEELREFRVERTLEFIRRLGQAGCPISLEDVERHANGNTLGRPHVALALVERGYAKDYHEAFNTYLNEGGLCYVNRRKLGAKDAIDIIRSAGGTAVLAHPGLITTDDLPSLVRELKGYGLEGIEALYPLHTDEQVTRYLKLAEDMRLLVTCGSDYHGSVRPGAIGLERREAKALWDTVAYLKEKYLPE